MNEEGKMAGWVVTLAGFGLWSLFMWSVGRWTGWARCFATAYNRGWEDRQKVEDYIERSKDEELQTMVAVGDGR